jgi:phenylacetate-CoA ligase
MLHIHTDVPKQAEWLARVDPHYLVTYPSNLRAVARHCRQAGIALPNLEQISTLAEAMSPNIRRSCAEAWGAPVKDVYSAAELGVIALQCPDHEHYHVQSEGVVVEVLHASGRPCAPGEIGQIVLTPLHNFAMPLIRYAIGDHAEVGPPCACGRGLPVLRRVLGRTRNMVTLPSGERRWPLFEPERLAEFGPIRQFQFIQKDLRSLEIRLAGERPLTREEEGNLTAFLGAKLGHNFATVFRYYPEIPRSPGGKYEEFKSEVVA